MIKIGITGGMGVGKSTISEIYSILKFPIYNSDIRSKYLLSNDEKIFQVLIQKFGTEILTQNNKIDRVKLGNKVFGHPENLSFLESILHPSVKEDFKVWLNHQKSDIIIKEAALMVESNTHLDLDYLIVIIADIETRLKRIFLRDALSKEEAMKRIERQIPQEKLVQLADFVIDNSNETMIIPQAIEIINRIINKV